MTITIQLPENLHRRAAGAGISDDELSQRVTDAAMEAAADASLPNEQPLDEVIEEAICLHAEGERGMPLDEAFAEIRSRLASPPSAL